MKKLVKTSGAIILLLCMILSLCACEEDSSTGIYELTVASLTDKEFYNGTTYDGLKLEVESTLEYETSDINVVIADDSIIDITFEKKETLFSNYISYNIICKSVGSTTFYFETSDRVVKSEEIEIVVSSNIKSISFIDDSELTFYDWQYDEDLSFEIESNESVSELQNILEFISENPEVATIEYDEDAWLSDRCKIKKVGVGETYVYIRTKDGTVQSEKIKVIVEAEGKEEETVVDTPVDNSRTVYITPTGKKYHYSRSCAGNNAIETTEDSAKYSYDPCKKCVSKQNNGESNQKEAVNENDLYDVQAAVIEFCNQYNTSDRIYGDTIGCFMISATEVTIEHSAGTIPESAYSELSATGNRLLNELVSYIDNNYNFPESITINLEENYWLLDDSYYEDDNL